MQINLANHFRNQGCLDEAREIDEWVLNHLEYLENPREDPLTVLGPRELEVLGQPALGRRNRDIARELHISESTVKFHVANILEKLGVGTRGEAAALAHEWGAAAVRAE